MVGERRDRGLLDIGDKERKLLLIFWQKKIIIILHLGLDIGDKKRKLLSVIYLFLLKKNDLTRAKRLKAGWIVLGN